MKVLFICGECGGVVSEDNAQAHFRLDCPNNLYYLNRFDYQTRVEQKPKHFIFEEGFLDEEENK